MSENTFWIENICVQLIFYLKFFQSVFCPLYTTFSLFKTRYETV